jgi:NADPH:quinone reductase-like Zn-dependent oxidoreductase
VHRRSLARIKISGENAETNMKAARIHSFGPPSVIVIDEIPRPKPALGEVLVRVDAAGVGPWDALIREKKAAVETPLPLILGSDLAGTIEETGAGVSGFQAGDAVYGVTNPQFIGAYSQYAIASAEMIARRPRGMDDLEAASAPVVAVTAWQMLFDYAQAKAGQTALILGAAGNVGAYAMQLASQAGVRAIGTASSADLDFVRSLGGEAIDRTVQFEEILRPVDFVLDLVGGDARERSKKIIRPGGTLVSVVSPFPESEQTPGIRTAFFLVEVTTARLDTLTRLFESGKLKTQLGTVLQLEQAVRAHEMLAGAPHPRGKIVLKVSA